jgi:uncharacterized protein with PIN domain
MSKSENICPDCNNFILDKDLTVIESGIQDDVYYYTVKCPRCKCVFNQWYQLKFIENLILSRGEN